MKVLAESIQPVAYFRLTVRTAIGGRRMRTIQATERMKEDVSSEGFEGAARHHSPAALLMMALALVGATLIVSLTSARLLVENDSPSSVIIAIDQEHGAGRSLHEPSRASRVGPFQCLGVTGTTSPEVMNTMRPREAPTASR